MKIYAINYCPYQVGKPVKKEDQQTELEFITSQIGKNVLMPDATRNYCLFNQQLTDKMVSYKEQALPYLSMKLKTSNDEKEIAETIYIADRLIDSGVKNVYKLYPDLARFNNTTSPTIQVLLAGIYRKTQLPEAFGPLYSMFIRNTFYPTSPYFNPNEEIGGALLEYLRNKTAPQVYSSTQK